VRLASPKHSTVADARSAARGRPAGGAGTAPARGLALRAHLLDEDRQMLGPSADEARHQRTVKPVQELPAAPALDEHRDEMARRPVA